MHHFLFSLLILLFSFQTGHCQGSKEWTPNIIAYRDYLLAQDTAALQQFRTLLKNWKIDEHPERFILLRDIILLDRVYKRKLKFIKKKIAKTHPSYGLTDSISEKNILILEKNVELINMINIDLLKGKYPFPINPKSELFKELDEYQLKKTDRVGEIGCGDGGMGLFLHITNPDIQLFLNEIDWYQLEIIQSLLDNNTYIYDSTKIKLIYGRRKTTNLDNYNLDKILIRNTFHHYKKKPQMLKSIKAALKEDGLLFIQEPTIESETCPKALPKDKIISIITANGFTLVKEVQFEYDYFFKFTITPTDTDETHKSKF